MSFKINVFVDNRQTGSYEIRRGEEFVIGREASNDIVILDRSVSRRHCTARLVEDYLLLTDLGSANGIYFEGGSHEQVQLRDGHQATLGTARLQVQNTATHTGMMPIQGLLDVFSESSSIDSEDVSESAISVSEEFLKGPGTPYLFRDQSDISPPTESSVSVRPEYKAIERDRLLLLVELGKSLGQSVELETLLARILDHLFEILPVRRAVIALTPDGETFSARVTRPETADLSAVASQGVLKQVVAAKMGQIIEDASLDRKLKSNMSVVASNIRAAICAPIVVNDHALGAIYADYPGRASLYSKSDLDFLTAFASIAGVSLENARMTEQLRERDRFRRELEIAGDIQKDILPNDAFEVEGFEIDWAYAPSLHVGGDFYDVIDFGNGKLSLIIGDVSGKSVPAAIYMSQAISILRATVSVDRPAGEALTRTNRLLSSSSERVMFATVVVLTLDRQEGVLTWSSAGHNPVLVRDPDSGEVRQLDANGPPLGIVDDFEFETCEAPLPLKSIVTLYTDGLVEARAADGEQLGLERVNQIVSDYVDEPVGTMTKAMIEAIREHHLNSKYIMDDVAILNIRVL